MLHEIGAADLGGRVGGVGPDADPDLERGVPVDDVVAGAAGEGVVAGAAEQDVPLPPDRAGQRASAGCGRRGDVGGLTGPGGDRREQVGQALDPGHAGLVECVAPHEPGPADQPRGGQHTVGALDHVVEVPAGIGFGLLPPVPVGGHLDRQAALIVVDHHVVGGRDGVALVGGPIEAAGAGVAVDPRVLQHDVVAALGVVVGSPCLTDQDVVARLRFSGVVEEGRPVVAVAAGPARRRPGSSRRRRHRTRCPRPARR